MSPPLASEFMGMASYAPTCFFDLMDDNTAREWWEWRLSQLVLESDGSSIGDMAPSHRLSRECAMADHPGHPPVEAESSRTHTSPNPHAETLELTLEHGEELRQRWLHQPPTTSAHPAHHTAPHEHRPVGDAGGAPCGRTA